jgi:hypothetical protein
MSLADTSENIILPPKTHFEFYTGGFTGRSFNILLEDGTLCCRSFGVNYGTLEVLIKIPVEGHEHWKCLLQYLTTQKWKGEYINEDVLDGTHWTLKVVNDPTNIDANGSNAYPRGFKKFLRMLNDITEEHNFSIS